MKAPLHIVHVTSEMVPFAKTGGLADVTASLPKAQVKRGHKATVFLPRYGQIAYPAGEFVGSVHVPVDHVNRSAGFYRKLTDDGVEVIFVEYPPFFERAQIYGEGGMEYADSRLRYAFLSRAAIEYYRSRGERPSLFHAHDWHAGLVPVYLKAFYWDDPTLHRMPSVFTIHNAAYQGVFGLDTVNVLGLPWNLATSDALEFHGAVSYMKGAILFSEMLTAVSPQYAQEIQGELGHSMEGVLRARSADLVGILNGVDYDEWDPSVDGRIAHKYSARDLSGKAACKADLLRAMGLPEFPDLPVVGVTSRLVHQKGFDIVTGSWWDLERRPMRLVALGSGENAVEDGLRALAQRNPDRFGVRIGYDTTLAHKIQAGADMFLMPSRFEPCGLTQMYALRYGTVPVVRSTGGLVDTVEPWNAATRQGTGFRFETADGTGMLWALDQAIAAWGSDDWRTLQKNGMAKDFSWERSARAYDEVYARALAKH
jgi:starch synthase